MAQRQKNKKPKVAEEEPDKAALEAEEIAEDALARAPEDSPAADDGEDEDESKASDSAEGETDDAEGEQKAAASPEGDEAEEDDAPAAGQLGSDRYVLAGFFAAG